MLKMYGVLIQKCLKYITGTFVKFEMNSIMIGYLKSLF